MILISRTLPPTPCGQGDYAAQLARQFCSQEMSVRHVIAFGATAARQKSPAVIVEEFGQNSDVLARLLNQSPDDDVLILMACRGYQRWGIPLHLLRALRADQRRNPNRKRVVMFHELWADVTWRSRHYILQIAQRWISRSLCEVADCVCALTESQAQRLRALMHNREVAWIPVGSNIPVVKSTQLAGQSPGRVLLFGLAHTRLWTLQQMASELRQGFQCRLITELHLVGPTSGRYALEEAELLRSITFDERVIRHGLAAPDEVSKLLQSVDFVLLGQNSDNLTKSGTFMAFAAHGCRIVWAGNISKRTSPPEQFFFSPSEMIELLASQNAIADSRAAQLRDWHDQNGAWSIVARQVIGIFTGSRGNQILK